MESRAAVKALTTVPVKLIFLYLSQMRFFYLALTCLFCTGSLCSQDTFSIVAVDSTTGEVGAAGASCVDLFNIGDISDDFLAELFPGSGAIATQAWYIPANQANARMRMQMGEHPDTIIQWLVQNDVQGRPDLRQYGIAAIRKEGTVSAAHTGDATDDYKGHITGPGYSIQGNILLGREVLENMEEAFLNTEGSLQCRLLEALQGANVVGADTRCTSNGSSSLFAFVKVTGPDDIFGSPAFVRSVRTRSGDGIEPIDSLQSLFDADGICSSSSINLNNAVDPFRVFPNPASDRIHIRSSESSGFSVSVIDPSGTVINDGISETSDHILDLKGIPNGVYYVRISSDDYSTVRPVVVVGS